MTLAEEQLYWMDKAKEFARSSLTESTIPWKEQWMADALYSAYLHGVEDAKGIRIIT